MSVLVGVGPQVNKFKQVSSDDHQMSVAGEEGGRSPGLMSRGRGVPYHVTCPMMHVMYLPPREKTDTCENITFLQLRLQAVTIGNVKERRISLW